MKYIFDSFGNKRKCFIGKDKFKKKKSFKNSVKSDFSKRDFIPKTFYDKEDLFKKISKTKSSIRTISITGHLHHGKSAFINLLASSVHLINDKFLLRTFSNLFFSEQERNLTIYPNVITLMLHSKKGQSHAFNFIDCPGHPDFQDQVNISMENSDGVILIIDMAEGVMLGTEISLKNAISRGLPLIVVLNALDRLIIELNLSPNEVHIRILSVIDELNIIIQKCLKIYQKKKKKQFKYFNPLLNNVCFSSLIQGWTFTLEQFSELYLSAQPSCCLSKKDLNFSIWNCFSTSNFVGNKFSGSQHNNSFLFQDLVLYPLFKLIFFNLTESYFQIRKLIETELGIYGIKIKELALCSEKVSNICLSLFFGGCRNSKLTANHSGIISSLNTTITKEKIIKLSRHKMNHFLNVNQKIGYITNYFYQKDSFKTIALCKILEGKVKMGDKVRILTNESFFYTNQKYFSIFCIGNLLLSIGRYRLKISIASKGTFVFIEGIENKSKKNGIFYGLFDNDPFQGFYCSSIKRCLVNSKIGKNIKISIKPDKMVNFNFLLKALRICSKIYPSLFCQIKSSGNIVISSISEFYLDCILQDIRNILGEIEFQISKPFIPLTEAVPFKFGSKQISLTDNLTLEIKYSIFQMKPKFPMLGFTTLSKKIYSKYKKKTGFFNSFSGGYISDKLEKNRYFDKINSNNIWFFDLDCIELNNSFLRGNLNLNFDGKKKKFIVWELKQFIKKRTLISEPLVGVEFILNGKQENKNNFRTNTFEKIKIKNFFPISKLSTREPVFFGEIIFPSIYFPMVLRHLKMKLAIIISFDDFFSEKIVLIRFQISGNMLIGFDHEISILTQGEGYGFFIFDFWKNIQY